MREILEKLLEERGLKVATFAKKIGVKTSTIDDILKGKTNELNIGVDKVLRIAEGLGTTVECLYGRGGSLSADECRLLAFYRGMNEEGQERLLGYADELAELQRYKKHNSAGMVQEQA